MESDCISFCSLLIFLLFIIILCCVNEKELKQIGWEESLSKKISNDQELIQSDPTSDFTVSHPSL